MGLISGIFEGTVLGIALMAGWKRMMVHRGSKRIAKAVHIKLLVSLSRDDLKKICGDNFPEWISFPVFEQAAALVIEESVEPLLEEYRPLQELKDLQVFTVIRVIFQLAEEIPCISAVVVALLSEPKPRIDYTLKAVGGSLTAIPGISDMIDDTVNSIVMDMIQWPHRIVIPLAFLIATTHS